MQPKQGSSNSPHQDTSSGEEPEDELSRREQEILEARGILLGVGDEAPEAAPQQKEKPRAEVRRGAEAKSKGKRRGMAWLIWGCWVGVKSCLLRGWRPTRGCFL